MMVPEGSLQDGHIVMCGERWQRKRQVQVTSTACEELKVLHLVGFEVQSTLALFILIGTGGLRPP